MRRCFGGGGRMRLLLVGPDRRPAHVVLWRINAAALPWALGQGRAPLCPAVATYLPPVGGWEGRSRVHEKPGSAAGGRIFPRPWLRQAAKKEAAQFHHHHQQDLLVALAWRGAGAAGRVDEQQLERHASLAEHNTTTDGRWRPRAARAEADQPCLTLQRTTAPAQPPVVVPDILLPDDSKRCPSPASTAAPTQQHIPCPPKQRHGPLKCRRHRAAPLAPGCYCPGVAAGTCS